MTSASKTLNAGKVLLQKLLITRLREGGKLEMLQTWKRIVLDENLWEGIVSYSLHTPQSRTKLFAVAFPCCFREQVKAVNAALEAGNNLNDLYALVCELSYIEKNEAGDFEKGKRGLKIRPHRKPE